MKFVVKTHRVPIIMDDNNKPTWGNVKLDETNLSSVEEVEVKESHDIIIRSREIAKWNNNKLLMVEMDPTIKEVEKQVLCKVI